MANAFIDLNCTVKNYDVHSQNFSDSVLKQFDFGGFVDGNGKLGLSQRMVVLKTLREMNADKNDVVTPQEVYNYAVKAKTQANYDVNTARKTLVAAEAERGRASGTRDERAAVSFAEQKLSQLNALIDISIKFGAEKLKSNQS
jgi:alpha/beta superfamily hydrolase